jgi:hypothetical protein
VPKYGRLLNNPFILSYSCVPPTFKDFTFMGETFKSFGFAECPSNYSNYYSKNYPFCCNTDNCDNSNQVHNTLSQTYTSNSLYIVIESTFNINSTIKNRFTNTDLNLELQTIVFNYFFLFI